MRHPYMRFSRIFRNFEGERSNTTNRPNQISIHWPLIIYTPRSSGDSLSLDRPLRLFSSWLIFRL
jgi:hypothetical protein